MYPDLSKAEMLARLAENGFPVPPMIFFSVGEWRKDPEGCLARLAEGAFSGSLVAVRSSARAEDGPEFSRAGAFRSLLNVSPESGEDMGAAIEEVRESLSGPEDQIIIQRMVERVSMSGVLMTRTLDDGSPYYVLNYDDASGRTDTVTSGRGISKTVYVYRGVKNSDFDSTRLQAVVDLARNLEGFLGGEPLDLEFAVDEEARVHLLQARRICAARHWSVSPGPTVESQIDHVAVFCRQLMTRRQGLYGSRSILGVMPDWNPAEMIGLHPRPLALSLYRELITRETWREARALMGYRALPPVELMASVGGRPYIDVRASFNSFLPQGLPDSLAERLVEAWLDRLDKNPALHDKVEFEIVPTVAEPDFEDVFRSRYGDLLTASELVEYRVRLTDLTARSLAPGGSLAAAAGDIEALRTLQETALEAERRAAPGLAQFDLALRLTEAVERCRSLGTRPFAVLARHGFIAETWLRAAVRLGALSPERVAALKRSIKTVSGELAHDFQAVLAGRRSRESFLQVYGHLRPGTYDLLSLSYRERPDLFEASPPPEAAAPTPPFTLNGREEKALEGLMGQSGLALGAPAFLAYVRRAVAGREYAKFVFTRHLDHILHLIRLWGAHLDLGPDDLTFLPLGDILAAGFAPLPLTGAEYFRQRIQSGRQEYELGRAFKLSYLIRSPRDVYIVPQHRSEPNFIGSRSVEAPVAVLEVHQGRTPDLAGHIVCIESADPGYDWIFTRRIAGLVTRYGGANSHMAIRCAEYGLPAAIGCGEQAFEMARNSHWLRLDCAARRIEPRFDGPLGVSQPEAAAAAFTLM